MRVYKDEEMRWSMLRYDSRTFTAQQAKMLNGGCYKEGDPGKNISTLTMAVFGQMDGCGKSFSRQIVRSLDGKPFSSARSERKLFFLRQ